MNDHVNGTIKPTLLQRGIAAIPSIGWLPRYQGAWLKDDLVAGLTLAAYAVPVAMAYASLAGLPPQVGLYCYLVGGLFYALFGSCRQLAIGPTAAISIMIASVAGSLAGGDPARYAAITAMTAALVGLMSIAAWLLRLSSVVNFISETILLGFKAGAAISIASTQFPKLFGIPGGGNTLFERLGAVIRQLPETNPVVLAVAAVALLLLLAGERWLPGRPVALGVVVLAIVAVPLLHLENYGLKVVGSIPGGLPQFSFPAITMDDLDDVTYLAFACFLLSYIESISAARTFGLKHHYTVDPRQELLGLGMANLAAAVAQGYPVAGGLSQSAVNDQAGARTPLALAVTSAVLALVLIFLTGLLRTLPDAVLAIVVIVAVMGFINIREFRRLWRISRLEFTVALVAFGGVLLFGILKGVVISAVASILLLLRGVAYPHVATLGRIPGTLRFSDVVRHPDNDLFPGILLFRVEAAILYFNVEFIATTILERVHAAQDLVKLVICDLSTSPYVDSAGGRMLATLEEELAAEGIRFRVAEAHAGVRELLRAEGLEQQLGGVSRHTSIPDIIEEFQGQGSA
jgi:SulP family sulfate permease